jgi:hypothetical protein
VHHEFIPPGQSIAEVATARQVARHWFLHHDNAPSYTSLVVQQFLAKKDIPVIIKLLHSPDLASSDFWLFPPLKMGLKGTCFATMKDFKSNATAELWKIPKEAFRRCFQQ